MNKIRQKVNLKYLWSFGGILIFAILATIAFEVIGFRGVIYDLGQGSKNDTTQILVGSFKVKLSQLSMIDYVDAKTVYWLGAPSLIVVWISLLIPLFGLFLDKSNRFWTVTIIVIVITFIAMALMIASAAEAIVRFNDTFSYWENGNGNDYPHSGLDDYPYWDYDDNKNINKGFKIKTGSLNYSYMIGMFSCFIVGYIISTGATLIGQKQNYLLQADSEA
ncbi:hypothetical protein [Mesoplasma lactucae]|uniref:Uncharacterized protein n=1 Tax=Mesoplasma lactucae ATCC 49193 TaxID=81460 RepID=A0A291IRT7_9MOLU|nr:hypothetical protein [Mesoplasma lactucae]ATG97464.1 hypothetical protein CP520_01675 [Mesoplasma lactucae ATCC 49193]ATZ20081.1 hypothetical protein MLACT_v1c02600 [Mesoplasma lactucae ATCC 49193]MCL8216829.1 hypothetical protein [Mesoplasma lactucae ATCC 49193]